MLEIALYQPDIAANAGAIARICACFGMRLTIIEPAGFIWDDSRLRRAGMDYLDMAIMRRSPSWEAFRKESDGRRLLLLSTKSTLPHTACTYRSDDILLLGRESAGVPDDVHAAANERLCIPMVKGARSLNVAVSAGIVAAEAQRQLASW